MARAQSAVQTVRLPGGVKRGRNDASDAFCKETISPHSRQDPRLHTPGLTTINSNPREDLEPSVRKTTPEEENPEETVSSELPRSHRDQPAAGGRIPRAKTGDKGRQIRSLYPQDSPPEIKVRTPGSALTCHDVTPGET